MKKKKCRNKNCLTIFVFTSVSACVYVTVSTLVRVPRDLLIAAEVIFNQTKRATLGIINNLYYFIRYYVYAPYMQFEG
jgi:hypothetical protein